MPDVEFNKEFDIAESMDLQAAFQDLGAEVQKAAKATKQTVAYKARSMEDDLQHQMSLGTRRRTDLAADFQAAMGL